MRQRAIIQVAGSPKAGKTTFIEALLRALDEDVTCIRAERDDSLRSPKETAPKTHAELRRYIAAGATNVAHYRFPVRKSHFDDFYMTDVMQEYSTAVVIEGDCPLEWADLFVFVASPLSVGASLWIQKEHDHTAEHAAMLDEMKQALKSSEALARFIAKRTGLQFNAETISSSILDETHRKMHALMTELCDEPPAKPTFHRSVAPGYENIERAQLVIVNPQGDLPHPGCDVLIREIKRLREDLALFKEVLGSRGRRTPITALTACLENPNDKGLKKAVARVKRVTSGAQGRRSE
jgi:hypothetical protein